MAFQTAHGQGKAEAWRRVTFSWGVLRTTFEGAHLEWGAAFYSLSSSRKTKLVEDKG